MRHPRFTLAKQISNLHSLPCPTMDDGPLHRRSIRVRLVDLPGALHEMTSLLAAAGVNIVRLEVVSREQSDVWDDVEITADSEEQLESAIRSMTSMGLTVIGLPRAWTIRDWAVDVLHALERLGEAPDPKRAVREFAETAATLANVDHTFVLMQPAWPDAAAAEARWEMIRDAAFRYDPDSIRWAGDSDGSRIVASAMKAARAEDAADTTSREAVGAVVPIPDQSGRPAHLVAIGQRPMFLAPELNRLKLFAQVAAPQLRPAPAKATT